MISLKKDIIPKLNKEYFFNDYKYKKSENRLILSTDKGFNSVEFYSKRTVDKRIGDKSEYGEFAIGVEPVYGIRFDILSKWFEKYSLKKLSDQRNNYTIAANGKDFNKQEDFLFLENGKDFKSDYNKFKEEIINNCTTYFNKFKTVEDYYVYQVLPIFEDKKQLPDSGADWIFEYLTAVKLIDKNRYEEMVFILKKQIEYMTSRRELNVARYYDKIDEIFAHLYNLDL